MKYIKNNFAGILTILALIGLIFKAFFAKYGLFNQNLIERSLTSFVIAYLAFKISYMETKKVGLILVPLVFHSLLMALVVNRGFSTKTPADLLTIITSLYRIIVILSVFFIIEFILNRLLGNLATSVIGGLSFLLYLAISFTKRFGILNGFEDFFLYFSFYVMALRVRSAARLNPLLLGLSILFVAGEVYLKNTYIKIDYDFLFTIFPLAYVSLKTISNESAMGFVDYIAFALIFIYPTVFILLKTNTSIDSLGVSIIAILSTYILGEAVFKIKNKYLSYLILGIN